jgi:hypothetical protein
LLYGEKENAFEARRAEHPHPANVVYLDRSDYHPFHDHLSCSKVKPRKSEDAEDFIDGRAELPQVEFKG